MVLLRLQWGGGGREGEGRGVLQDRLVSKSFFDVSSLSTSSGRLLTLKTANEKNKSSKNTKMTKMKQPGATNKKISQNQ